MNSASDSKNKTATLKNEKIKNRTEWTGLFEKTTKKLLELIWMLLFYVPNMPYPYSKKIMEEES